ncbi:MAG: hypothetical protein LBN96_01240 [Desulfovibrio sp.]|jgi:hypothetical protein|nr:hypothetical protein [Desulfovibrio sp.]
MDTEKAFDRKGLGAVTFPFSAMTAAALLAFTLSGCAGLQDAPSPAPPLGPAGNFIVTAEPGQSKTLDDPAFGSNICVTADSAFTSAKGEECRRATVTVQGKEAEIVVICRPEGNNWIMAPRVWGDDRM